MGKVAVAKLRRAVRAPLNGVRGTSSSGRGTVTVEARRCRTTAASARTVRATRLGQVADLADRVDEGHPDLVGPGRGRLQHHVASRTVTSRSRVASEPVDDVAEQCVGGDPVGERVVHLGDHRDPVVAERLADVHLPQRTGAVQRRTGHSADQRLQSGHAARSGHVVGEHVVRRVDGPVGDPQRVVEVERRRERPSLQGRQLGQPRDHLVLEPGQVEGLGRLQHRDLERVHVHGGRLHVEIPGVNALHAVHAAKSGRPRVPTARTNWNVF